MSDEPSPDAQRVVKRAVDALFGRPLVTNVVRAVLVEAMVADALSPHWNWCAADYASWDFEHPSGVRLEVKQSAARQSWSGDASGPSRGVFDIRHRTGHWRGAVWVEGLDRHADIYVFAHHPIADRSADHRDPGQWRFYVVPTHALPPQKTIGSAGVAERASPVAIDRLAAAIDAARCALPSTLREMS